MSLPVAVDVGDSLQRDSINSSPSARTSTARARSRRASIKQDAQLARERGQEQAERGKERAQQEVVGGDSSTATVYRRPR